MDNNTLWSLRLGFSAKQSEKIKKMGVRSFLERSFDSNPNMDLGNLLANSPKSSEELKAIRNKLKTQSIEEKKVLLKNEIQVSNLMKATWIDKMYNDDLPLLEKMTLFWHNHYVATYQKVKVNYWIYQHNQILRENAFGNFKTLTKKIIQSNAMVRYLDNTDNRKGKYNENLSRELLELFTLGIGNYTEDDIKNGAKGLAGLGLGEENAIYRPFFENKEPFTYFGKTGNFKVNEMIDIIFEQLKIPYLITRKILKYFIYDSPKEELVIYYGNYFKKVDFEIKPLLIKIFTEEYEKENAGSKIKNPLEYILQVMHELNIEKPNSKLISFFCKEQGMDLFNQPNVKGWIGGNSWLTSQIFLQRNNTADLLCNGKSINRRFDNIDPIMSNKNIIVPIKIFWNKKGNNKDIISELKQRLIFETNPQLQLDFEEMLKYDFNPNTDGSENAVLRLFNFMIKTPEFQLI